jgi:HK97 family phage major capsid protein
MADENEDAITLDDATIAELENAADQPLAPKLLDGSALQAGIAERASLFTEMNRLNEELDSSYDAEKDAQWDALNAKFEAVDASLQAHNRFVDNKTARQEKQNRQQEAMERSGSKELINRLGGGIVDPGKFDPSMGGAPTALERNRIANAAVYGYFKGVMGKKTKVTQFERDSMDKAGVSWDDREGIDIPLCDTHAYKRVQEIFSDEVGSGRDLGDSNRRRSGARKRIVDALDTATGGSENYLFGTTFAGELEEALLAYGEMRQFIDVIRTSDGTPIYIGTMNDTSNAGEMMAESLAEPSATTITYADPTFSRVVLNAYKGSSKGIVISQELLEDNEVNMLSNIPKWLGQRLGRLTNNIWTLGTGTTQADGIVPQSTLGKTAAAAGVLTFDELADLKGSIEYGIITTRACRFMFTYATKNYLQKIKDLNDRPIWQVDLRSSAPATIYEHEFVINQDMAEIATGNKSVIFGDLNAYKGREVNSIRTYRLQEIRRTEDQDLFTAFNRFDGRLLDPGDNPVKHLIHP